MLSVGGKVTVAGQAISEKSRLPATSFAVDIVNLMRCELVDDDLRHLIPISSLKNLILNNTDVSDGCVQVIARFQELEFLHIDGTQITGRGLSDLTRLPKLRMLQTFGLGLNDSDIQYIVVHSQLGDVNLAGNPITDRGLAELQKLKNLGALQIQFTDVTDAGLESLKRFPNLGRLYLGSSKITDAGLKHLARVRSLRHLRFYSAAKITDQGLNDLIKMKWLTELWLVGTGVTEAGVKRLKARMRKTKVVYDAGGLKPVVGAVAPFDETTAVKHQQVWAKHLGTGVETSNSIGMKLRLIPPGEFIMGSPQAEIETLVKSTNDAAFQGRYRNETKHKVTLTKPFYLGVYEVTQAQYRQVMGSNPSYHSATGAGKDQVAGLDTGRYPVETVSWLDAIDFCIKLSRREGFQPYYRRDGNEVTILDGNGYRLPTEAEWEFACRAGTQTRFSFGDNEQELPQYCWSKSNSVDRTHAVGELRGNPFGLYDTYGNVWECCQDRYGAYGNGNRAVTDPRGSVQGNIVLRGGSYQVIHAAANVRSAYRSYGLPHGRSKETGFRVARTGSGSQAGALPE